MRYYSFAPPNTLRLELFLAITGGGSNRFYSLLGMSHENLESVSVARAVNEI